MSYFNEEQQSYMRELAALPPEAKCGCGWYRAGTCPMCVPSAGGYERCEAVSGDATCSRKRGHDGEHVGWPRHQISGSLRVWAAPDGGPS